MSSIQYIEIDSTYRNRTNWPNPAEFEVLVSQSGKKDKMNADDPVSCSAPLNNFSWSPNGFSSCGCRDFIDATINSVSVAGIGAAGDNNTVLVVTQILYPLQTISNYYTGAILKNHNTGNTSRITSYTHLGQNRAQITIDGMPNTSGNKIEIHNPSDLSNQTNPFMFVPNGRNTNNAYPNSILYNENQLNYVKILGYDQVTRLLKLGDISGLGWSLAHKYSIRTSKPQSGFFQNNDYFKDGAIFVMEKSFFSLPTNFSDQENIYKNSFIYSNSQARRIIRYETLTGKVVNTIGSTTSIQFPSNASNINGYYNGFYITIISGLANAEVRKIMSYTVTGTSPNFVRTASVDTPFTASVIAGDEFTFRSGVTEKPFTSILGSSRFEILPFCYDNHNPLVYTGSMQQESVCYQIELLDLILPNKILNSGNGGRIAFYPYVYVELSNISGSSSGTKHAIYSNNPNSTRMVFRVPIYDVQNPLNSSFVKLDGDGMVQTLKFKTNDNIFFSVRLSNGELFKTVDEELYNPFPPNPEIQISAIFSFKRL